uniref:Copia protein n=1 Tax=Amphimedon queenslandica TaxID=400682 RepID=A0A1X7TRF5_AMPQE
MAATTFAALAALLYIKGTINLSLCYKGNGKPMFGYSDVDLANDSDNRHSTSGNIFLLVGGAIRLSTDYHTKEPTDILEDNQGAIATSKNPVGLERTKHIDIKHHFIRETIQAGTIILTYCPTKDMIAETFTKALPRDKLRILALLRLVYNITQVLHYVDAGIESGSILAEGMTQKVKSLSTRF